MQISYVGQYNKNAGQPVGTPVPSTAVTSLTAAVRELVPGSIFEGNIAFVKGSNVILSLENGQNVHARLDKNALKLVQGQSMFFQVKSNEDGVVAIRPYMGTGTSNPTLMRALQAAGLPIDDRNLQMVDAMMREQMPINADALAEMHRAVVGNEGVGVDTLVQMRKLDLPITPQMAAQFENYRNDTHMLLGQMNDLMEALPQFLESQSMDLSQMVQMNSQLFGILSEGMTDGTDAAILADADRVQQMMDAEGAAGITAPDAAEGEVEGMFFDSEAADAQPLVRYAPQQLGAVLDPQMQESLKDFEYFNNMSAEYSLTFPSLCFLMTHERYDTTKPTLDYFDRAWSSDGCERFYDTLHRQNYEVKMCVEANYAAYDAAHMLGKADNVVEAGGLIVRWPLLKRS